MIGRLGSLRVLSQISAAEQSVGRERNQIASYRQLARNAVVSRRVNSTVRAHRSLKDRQTSARLGRIAARAAFVVAGWRKQVNEVQSWPRFPFLLTKNQERVTMQGARTNRWTRAESDRLLSTT